MCHAAYLRAVLRKCISDNAVSRVICFPVVDVIKLFLEEIEISPKLRNWIKFVLMTEPAQKCEN